MVVFLLDFLVFELGDSLVLSVLVDSLAGEASAFVFEDFFELLLVESALLCFSLVLVLFGLVALSAAGLFVVFDDFGEGEAVTAG